MEEKNRTHSDQIGVEDEDFDFSPFDDEGEGVEDEDAEFYTDSVDDDDDSDDTNNSSNNSDDEEDNDDDSESSDDEGEDELDDDFVGESYSMSEEGKKAFQGAVDKKYAELESLIVDGTKEDRLEAAKSLEELSKTKPKLAEAVAREFTINGEPVESVDQLISKLKGEDNNTSQAIRDPEESARILNLEIKDFVRDKLEEEGIPYKEFLKSKTNEAFKKEVQDFIRAGAKPSDFLEKAWKLATLEHALEKSYNEGLKAKRKIERVRNSQPTHKTKQNIATSGVKYGKSNLMTLEEWEELQDTNPKEAARYYRETGGKFK